MGDGDWGFRAMCDRIRCDADMWAPIAAGRERACVEVLAEEYRREARGLDPWRFVALNTLASLAVIRELNEEIATLRAEAGAVDIG